jgi:chemotaxis protein MotB
MKQNQILLGALISITAMGCVSASKHRELEESQSKTQEALAVCEKDREELQKKLGVTSTQKTSLEGTVANMKQALTELEARKAETEKRLAEFKSLTEKFKKLVDAGKLSIKVRNGRMMIALSTDVLFSSGSAKLSDAGAGAIQEVAALLKDIPSRNFQVEVGFFQCSSQVHDFALFQIGASPISIF